MTIAAAVTDLQFEALDFVTVPGARQRLEKYAIIPEATTRLDNQMVFLWEPPPWTISDASQRIVEGYASLPNLDDQGDVIPMDVIADALPDFMKWANGREMHGKSAAGKILKAQVDDKGLWIVYKVTDPTAWAKCETATYQGFSVGGDVTKMEKRPDGVRVITGLKINEISLVDRPANQQAKIYVMKSAAITEGTPDLIEKYRVHELLRCEKHGKKGCEECGCDRTVGHPTGSSPEAERPGQVQDSTDKAADLSRETSESKRKEYGDVNYGDPKHHAYPLNTAKRVRAAWSYINNPKNTSGRSDVSSIKSKIRAAAKRFGITLDTEKYMSTTLEKIRAQLSDPQALGVVDQFEKLLADNNLRIEKDGGTNEWHTQSNVGDLDNHTNDGLDFGTEEDDIGDDEIPLDDFLKAVADAEEKDAAAGDTDGDTQKAANPFGKAFGHAKALAGNMQKLNKAMSDGDATACKSHMTACKRDFARMHKAFSGASKAAKAVASKALAQDREKMAKAMITQTRLSPELAQRLEKVMDDKIENAIVPLINRMVRLQNHINGLPLAKAASRSHLSVMEKDEEMPQETWKRIVGQV